MQCVPACCSVKAVVVINEINKAGFMFMYLNTWHINSYHVVMIESVSKPHYKILEEPYRELRSFE